MVTTSAVETSPAGTHDPRFDVREALYYATGMDRTAIEGIDQMQALTLVSELGTDFSKWPTVTLGRGPPATDRAAAVSSQFTRCTRSSKRRCSRSRREITANAASSNVR